MPSGVDLRWVEDGVRVRARAGGVGWQPVAALAISVPWTAYWGRGLAVAIVSMATAARANVAPELFVHAVAALAGAYCAALCLWTMFGHETLVVAGNGLWVSNPWLFGLRTRRFDLKRVEPFRCSAEECGVGPDEGCCCRWSTNECAMSFGYRGRRIPVFAQLPTEAKERLCERLNRILPPGARPV